MTIDIKDPLIGRGLGDFVIKKKLGQGGFGTVYYAEQLTLARAVVIKVLNTNHRDDQELIERFKREAYLASRLEHPYTAHIYAFGAEADGLLWLAMELVQGTPLDRVLDIQGVLPLEKFIPLFDKICEVVHTAHELGITHRDLKPANVMLIVRAGKMLPKLLDFGIAKSFGGQIASNNSRQTMFPLPIPKIKFSDSADKHNFTTKQVAENESDEETRLVKTNNNDGTKRVVDSDNNQATLLMATIEPSLIDDTKTPIINNPIDSHSTDKANQVGSLGRSLIEESNEYQTQGSFGSPAYMPPEQWDNAANANASSDIYSLGVMAYQLLTGNLPFKGNLTTLLSAHLTNPVPSLGAGFPPKMDQVIVKAMAKEQKNRYATALQFAQALREAAGVSDERLQLPQLAESFRNQLLLQAPQPLAQAIAELSSARSAYQLRDLVIEVLKFLVRYIGLLTLACRVQIGSGRQDDSEQVKELCKQLLNKGLNELEWGYLAQELARPFAKQSDAYPIPEIINIFYTATGETNKENLAPFFVLLKLLPELAKKGSPSEQQIKEALEKCWRALEQLLQVTANLFSYELASIKENYRENWQGISRTKQDLAKHLNLNLKVGDVILFDSLGNPVTKLSPLIQAVEPSPGAKAELFFLEKRGRYGAKLVSLLAGFEHYDETLLDWFREKLFAESLDEANHPNLPEQSPYLGLVSFTPEDTTFFFGRDRETESFLNRLKVQPLLVVVGASGAGKSSFIQAGIVPSLEGWQVITIRPGSSPLATLTAKLNKEKVAVSDLKAALAVNISALAVALHTVAKQSEHNLLLVIDQFEELFTLCLDLNERNLFAQALVLAAQSAEEPVRIILTLRDDFLLKAKELTGLKDHLNQGLELLTTPGQEGLLKILIEPAKRVGYEFEDPQLALEIVESVVGQAGALPLLAFTAAKLWELRDRQFKQLRRKVYQSMSGVGGALAQHAETMLQEMTHSEQKKVREAFRQLVTSEGTRAVLIKPDLIQLLGGKAEAENVLEKLVSARLLTASEGENGLERVEIIHEALLKAWPRLVTWRQEDAEGARLRDQLRVAARQWAERERSKGLLWRDEALTEYQLWRDRYQGKLTAIEEEFGATSQSEASRSQRLKRGLFAAAIVVLIVGSAILLYQQQQTKQQLEETLKLYEEQGRQEMLKGNPDGAAVYLSEAYTKGDNSLALRYMLPVALAKAENRSPLTLANHTGAVMMATFSPDDQKAVTASVDKTARIWQTIDGKELFVLKGHEDTVVSAQFSPDGRQIITSSLDKTARIWQVANGSLVATLAGHTDGLCAAIFSPNGKQIVTASYDKTAKIWDAATGKLLNTLAGHEGAIYAVCYSKDGKLIATASADKTAKIWDSSNGQLKTTLSRHQASVVSVAFSPDDKLIVTGSADKTACSWQVTEGTLFRTLTMPEGGVTDSKFSPDGKAILTTSSDSKAYLWEAETGNLISTLEGHQGDIVKGDFSPDGKFIMTSSYDKTVGIWERATRKFLVSLIGHKAAVVAVFGTTGRKILSASEDNAAKIWELGVESRLPLEISTIVKDKVPIYLKEGRLITKEQPLPITTKKEVKAEENLYIEDIGNGIKIEMVKIAAGEFEMGSPTTEKGHSNDETLHRVKITASFYMGKYEVTQSQWKTIATLPPINMRLRIDPAKFKGDNLPVEQVTWEEAGEFCARLSKITGKAYRLPTEAEWEYAARAGSKSEYPENLDDVAWYEKNAEKKTNPVGEKRVSPWGLYDIYGNVWEWCSDWYGEYSSGTVTDPIGVSSGDSHVNRGGSWYSTIALCRLANRNHYPPNSRHTSLGFRLVMILK